MKPRIRYEDSAQEYTTKGKKKKKHSGDCKFKS